MKIYKESKSEQAEIIKPVDDVSEDKGLVKRPSNPSEHKPIPDDIKEIIAIDGLENGVREAAKIHGIGKSTVARIVEKSEARTEVLASKFDINNLATAKLMQTLNLLNPFEIEKEKDKVSVINGLAKVIDIMEDGGKNKDGKSVHLHLYAPNQKKESDYDTIEVGGRVQ